MKIVITDFAKTQLRDIYNYYSILVSENTAAKLINKLIDAIEDIERYPSIGTKEPLLASLRAGHKFVVAGNYKVIFRVEAEIIYITDIFD